MPGPRVIPRRGKTALLEAGSLASSVVISTSARALGCPTPASASPPRKTVIIIFFIRCAHTLKKLTESGYERDDRGCGRRRGGDQGLNCPYVDASRFASQPVSERFGDH